MQGLPPTERASGAGDLDLLSVDQLVTRLHAAYAAVGPAVAAALPALAAAVRALVERWPHGGRLILVGAGTSGRVAVAEAAECPPTFGTPPERVLAVLAGGSAAMLRSVEGGEDDAAAGERAMADLRVGPADVVVGVSASGGAPFAVAAVTAARAAGAVGVAVTAVEDSPLARAADIAAVLPTGPEPVAGSTRMLAGSAQKMALNILTTAAMARLGHVHGDRMVDFTPTNAKLRARAVRTVQELAGVGDAEARQLLLASRWQVKVANLCARGHLDAEQARARLVACDGSLRRALQEGGR